MEVGAKTGTTNDAVDRWLCGITPYYTAAAWYGYDEPERIYFSGNPAAQIWAAVMRDIHADLKSANFTKPDNVVTATVCLDTGEIATQQCTRTYTEYFVKGDLPDKCGGHTMIQVCKETGYKANEFCPGTEERASVSRPEKEIHPSWSTSENGKYDNDLEVCPVHAETAEKMVTVPNVVGKTKADAQKEFIKVGLKYTIETKTDASKTDGVVLSQNTQAGTEVAEGTVITMVVNELEEEEPPQENEVEENETIDNTTVTNDTDVVDNTIDT